MHSSIAAMLAGQMLAMDYGLAQNLLALDIPSGGTGAAALTGGGLRIEAGERFAVHRGVAVMPIRGILTPANPMLEKYLGWSTYEGIEVAAAQIGASDEIAAVVLDIDTPGGLVVAMEAAANAIATLSKAKPVYALINPVAASAAYFLASQASEIVMTAGSVVGSIGVMWQGGTPVQPDMYGNQSVIITSSLARAKRPNPMTDIGRAEIQRSVDEAEAVFHAAVARGRGIAANELPGLLSVSDDVADGGAVFGPKDAIQRRLADRMETRAAFYEHVFARHGMQPKKPTSGGARAMTGHSAIAAAAMAIAQT
jgi:ClpP class serine protease